MALLDKARAAMPAKPAPLAKAAASAPAASRPAVGVLPLPPLPVCQQSDGTRQITPRPKVICPGRQLGGLTVLYFYYLPVYFSLPPASTAAASAACSSHDVTEDRVDAKNSKATSAPKGGKVSWSVSNVHVLQFIWVVEVRVVPMPKRQ